MQDLLQSRCVICDNYISISWIEWNKSDFLPRYIAVYRRDTMQNDWLLIGSLIQSKEKKMLNSKI